jgi:hypothetical protein
MPNILAVPGPDIPIATDGAGKGTSLNPVWRRWFIDLVKFINKSGGLDGAVPQTATLTVESPLDGGGTIGTGLTLSFAPVAANAVLVGPPSGAAAVPTFRALVAGDLPGISVTITTAKLTPGGTNGSMTFTNGILTNQVQAT